MQQFPVFLPGCDLQKCIKAGQKIYSGVRRITLTQIPQRVNSICGSGQFGFNRRTNKLPSADQGCMQHFDPIAERGELRRRLMRRSGGRYKDNLIESALRQRIFCKTQMPVMDRVEGPAEKADFFAQARTCPWPKTTNFRVVNSSRPIGP